MVVRYDDWNHTLRSLMAPGKQGPADFVILRFRRVVFVGFWCLDARFCGPEGSFEVQRGNQRSTCGSGGRFLTIFVGFGVSPGGHF